MPSDPDVELHTGPECLQSPAVPPRGTDAVLFRGLIPKHHRTAFMRREKTSYIIAAVKASYQNIGPKTSQGFPVNCMTCGCTCVVYERQDQKCFFFLLVAPRAIPLNLTPGVSDSDQLDFLASKLHLEKNKRGFGLKLA